MPTPSSLQRALHALHFPNHAGVDVDDCEHYRTIVTWLEDHKIMQRPIAQRADLRDKSSQKWTETYRKYLDELGCPYKNCEEEHLQQLDWLLKYALALQYAENSDELYQYRAGASAQNGAANPLDKLDVNSEEFKEGVKQLAEALNVPRHPDHMVVLEACCKLIVRRLSDEALQKVQPVVEGEQMKLEDFKLGFDTKDPVLNNVCRVMRLLHVHELRDLQNAINETIVAVQNVSADPKTALAQAKVGRS